MTMARSRQGPFILAADFSGPRVPDRVAVASHAIHGCACLSQEAEMLRASTRKEIDKLQQNMLQQSQRLEAAQQRIGDLEVQLTKKEHLIVEQKLFLEDVKSQAKYSFYLLTSGEGLGGC